LDETLTGIGSVRSKDSGAAVADGVRYSIHVSRPSGRALWHIDAAVDLDLSAAWPLINKNETATLTLEDGREFDFLVQSVEPMSGDVHVVAKGGGIRAAGSCLESGPPAPLRACDDASGSVWRAKGREPAGTISGALLRPQLTVSRRFLLSTALRSRCAC
jgi:hypothetical protein